MGKKTISGKPAPAFELVFTGGDVAPEKLPLHIVTRSIQAAQTLALARDPELPPSADEDSIRLMRILRGSARFLCVSVHPGEIQENLRSVGQMLEDPAADNGQRASLALKPIEKLSRVAKSLDCRILFRDSERKTVFAKIEATSYDRLAKEFLTEGDTQIVGKIERVGGATERRCAIRIPGRRQLFFCDVANDSLTRRLGRHLYEDVIVTGRAMWVHSTWSLFQFLVTDVSQTKAWDPSKAIAAIREASGNAWDDVDDPAVLIREMRE
jgi:hypothetical protein